jgi:dihydroxyacetone kinase-like predicted kinase
MNPSTAEILRAIEAAPSENVVVLPNNKNVIGTAKETPALTKKHVRIVPTRSVQAGVSALLAYSPDAPLDETASNMEDAAAAVSAGAVCKATRDVELDGHRVRRGAYIGLLDDRVVAVASTPAGALDRLLEGRATSGSVVTIYTGDAVSEKDAEGVADRVRAKVPDAEVEVVKGGQPHYDYLVSIE